MIEVISFILSFLSSDLRNIIYKHENVKEMAFEYARNANLSLNLPFFIVAGYVNNSLTIDKECKGCQYYINERNNRKLIFDYEADVFSDSFNLGIKTGFYRIVPHSDCLGNFECTLITNANIGAIPVSGAYSESDKLHTDLEECKAKQFLLSYVELCTNISRDDKYLYSYRVSFSVRPSHGRGSEEWDFGLRYHENLYSYYSFLGCEELFDSQCE